MGEIALALRGEVLLFEAQTRPVQQGLDCALGHLQGAGDLAVAHVLELAQREDQAVLLGHALVVFLFWRAVGPEVPLPPAQRVGAEIARDGVDPAAEVERVVDPVHHPEGLHEGFLRYVLSEQGVAKLAPDKPVDGSDVAPVQLFKRVYVTVPIRPDQLDVARAGALLRRRFVFLYVHLRLRQATTVARISIPSGSFKACCKSEPPSVSVTTEVTPDRVNASQPGPVPPARRIT